MIKQIAIHHSGGYASDPYASTANLTIEQIDNAHKDRWPDMKSELGYYVGYNFVITKDGKLTQTRKLGEETAAQKGYNTDTISICLTGNFNLLGNKPIDTPTTEQIETLKNLLIKLCDNETFKYRVVQETTFNLSWTRIYPHRYLGQTDCNGTSLDFLWGRRLVEPYFQNKINILQNLIAQYLKLLDAYKKLNTKLGASQHSCWEGNERG